MATLIKNGNGGRCCAKCYNAQRPICTCICGGENHGKGLGLALQNTRDMHLHQKSLEIDLDNLVDIENSDEEDFGVRIRDEKIFVRSTGTLMHKNQIDFFEELLT